MPEFPLDLRVRRTWRGLIFYSLDEHDAFCFQVLHIVKHILYNWCRLGWLWEIDWYLNTRPADSLFWQELNTDLERDERWAEVVALVTSLAARLFQPALPKRMKARIPGAMRDHVALWVDRYGLRSALDNFSKDKYALFLHREFVKDESTWQTIRTSRLLPLHRPNQLAGSATPVTFAPLPESWRQTWYVVRRAIHHSLAATAYAWESVRWDRLRRQSAGRDLA